MGVFSGLFSIVKYSYTKPFKDVSGSLGRIKDSYDVLNNKDESALRPRKYEDLKTEDREIYQRRLTNFRQRAVLSMKFGWVLKIAGASWAFYNFVLTANAIYTKTPSFSYFLSMLSGLLVFAVGAFWINSYRQEIDKAEAGIKGAGAEVLFTKQEESRLLRNFVVVKRTALVFFMFSLFLTPYYLFFGSFMDFVVSLSFCCVMLSHLFKYSLWIYQIRKQELVSVKVFFERCGRLELLNPYL